MNIGEMVGQYGFPIIAVCGLGYFIFYIWKWVTEDVDPVIHESHMTLIGLIDRVRMLDNDLIRLRAKLDMILQQKERDLSENVIRPNSDNTSDSNTDSADTSTIRPSKRS
tara:strand:- start:16655 stop:16984 length:330 start_codon:yes stop_codon:yes gene_type:complete